MILPRNDFQGNSPGENYIWQKFQEFLPESYVSFHNYSIDIKQPDIMLMAPDLGVLVIEIKSIKAKNIFDIPDNSIIRMKNSPPIPSPFAQATKYRNQLIDKLKANDIENVYVVQSIAFPYISREEFSEKDLGKICDERLTILSEDFRSKEAIIKKFDEIFMLAYEKIAVPKLEKFGFNAELMIKVGNVLSPNYLNKTSIFDEEYSTKSSSEVNLSKENEQKKVYYKNNKPFFSILSYSNEDSPTSEKRIIELVNFWELGTKIYYYSSKVANLEKAKHLIEKRIESLGINDRKSFRVYNYGTFNFQISHAQEMEQTFEIIDGIGQEEYSIILSNLHKNSSFNYDQYKIEHAPIDNLIVKAGAGTGKTYSIISRIDYLIWKKEYSPEELSRAIAMITFTNESADAMREKLQAHFISYYLLTRNSIFLEYIEAVEDMKIATIHSMAKLILQKFGSIIGLGKDFSIVTGVFQREKVLSEIIDRYIADKPSVPSILYDKKMKIFHFKKRIISLLEKTDNKNIDLTDESNEIDFGVICPKDFDFIIHIMKETQIELNDSLDMFNKISLGDLMKKLSKLYKSIDQRKIDMDYKIDFLFVDEFQDTDDVQIELIKSFQRAFGYYYFVVGDVKQCIYRFRGAEVKAFDTLVTGETGSIYQYSLNKNYRTDIYLMNRFNKIFTFWNKKGLLEYNNSDILMGTRNFNQKPLISSIIHDRNSDDFNNKLVDFLKKESERLDEEEVIAVLVRFNSQVSQIKKVCEDKGLYIETEVGGELFSIDPTIDFYKLVLALKYYSSGQHLFNLYTTSYILEDLPKSALWNLKDEEIVHYFYMNLPKSLEKWEDYLEQLRKEPVLKVLRDIIDDVRPWDIFSKKIKSGKEDADRNESYYIRNLDQLFEKLVEAANTDYLTINKISEHLEIMILTRKEEESRASYDIEKSKSKIICTTVHKAKGLEFSTVVLPFTRFKINTKRARGDVDLIFSDRKYGFLIKDVDDETLVDNTIYDYFEENELVYKLHEETRILYVAMTRAIKKLVYFSDNSPFNRFKIDWRSLIEEVVA